MFAAIQAVATYALYDAIAGKPTGSSSSSNNSNSGSSINSHHNDGESRTASTTAFSVPRVLTYDQLFLAGPGRVSFQQLDGAQRNQTWKRGWSLDFYGLDRIHGRTQTTIDTVYGWGSRHVAATAGLMIRFHTLENGRLKVAVGRRPTMPREMRLQAVVHDIQAASGALPEYETTLAYTARRSTSSLQFKYFAQNCMPWSTPAWQPRTELSYKLGDYRMQVAGFGANFLYYVTPYTAYGMEILGMKKRLHETQLHTVISIGALFRPVSSCSLTARLDNYGEAKLAATFPTYAWGFLRWIPGMGIVGLNTMPSLDGYDGALFAEASHCPLKRGSLAVASAGYETEHRSTIISADRRHVNSIVGKVKVATDGKISGRLECSLPDVFLTLAVHGVYMTSTSEGIVGLEVALNHLPGLIK